jgi:hypothetical protein
MSFGPDPSGRVVVQGEELDRIELILGPSEPGVRYAGYLQAGSELRGLPMGSRLDEKSGMFTWQPVAGFVHAYDLVFLRCQDGVSDRGSVVPLSGLSCARREVRIVLNPKRSNLVGPQVVIDTPSDGQDVGEAFTLAGWAVDRDADLGTGVDTVHVWAYPAGGGDPLFLGATAYGGARPDVAATQGARFEASGYGIIVDSLPPGTYRLAVFAWSVPLGRFLPAKVVRVTVTDRPN